jgi:oligopeptide transport system substrate-binding protein
MSGLKVVDDHTFTIKTTEKVSNLPVRVGYSAFAPLPGLVLRRQRQGLRREADRRRPLQDGVLRPGTGAVLSRTPTTPATSPARSTRSPSRSTRTPDAAYNDVIANQTDLHGRDPGQRPEGDDKYKSDLPDRNAEKETGVIADDHLPLAQGRQELRQPEDAQGDLDGDRPRHDHQEDPRQHPCPATGWVSPVVDGYKADQCGEYCTYDPAKAKAKLDEAGGYKGDDHLGYNADGDHKEWTEAACNSHQGRARGRVQGSAVPVDFATFRTLITDRKMKGMFRTGWQMDYPSIENFLAPIYGTGAGSNDGDYSSEKFDTLIKEAAAAADRPLPPTQKYQEAEAQFGHRLPEHPDVVRQGHCMAGPRRSRTSRSPPFGTIDLARSR